VDSLEYFRLPRLGAASITAMVIAAMYVAPMFFGGNTEIKPWSKMIPGVIFLLGIGVSEEIFSRGLNFGMFRHYGERKAMIISSEIFGLLHLNVYVGNDWDTYAAYSHVVSAGCWGYLACAIMIATRSIWFVALFHAMTDWHLVFRKVSESTDTSPVPIFTMWDNIITPWVNWFTFIPAAMLIMRVNRGGWPKWIEKLALRFKLVTPVGALD